MVQLSRLSREKRLSRKLFKLAANSRESSLVLTHNLVKWKDGRRNNLSLTVTVSKKMTDSKMLLA